jgi:hypothetical protein
MKVMSNGKRFTQGATWELGEKRITVEKIGHQNSAINEIHNNPDLSREEKIAFAKKIIAGEKEVAAEKKANDTKSKVCHIANRLTKQGMNRPEAFRRAWATVKAETLETKVAGVTIGRRQEALERLIRYEADSISVSLERESANEYDGNAVKVITTVQGKGSYTVGYLPRTLAATIAPLIDAGKAVRATFKEIRGKYHNYHNYGMAVSVSI